MKGRTLLGLLLALLGAALLLDRLEILSFAQTLGTWWPALLILAGVVQMVQARRFLIWSGLLAAFGAALLAQKLDLITVNVWNLVWPTVLLLVGLALLFPGGGPVRRERNTTTDRIDRVVAFGGLEETVRSDAFRGGSVIAAFGGADIDLRQATLAKDGAHLEVTACFGGAEVQVPRDWRVEVSGMPVLGGVVDETHGGSTDPDAPVLRIAATACFGGVEVNHGDDEDEAVPEAA